MESCCDSIHAHDAEVVYLLHCRSQTTLLSDVGDLDERADLLDFIRPSCVQAVQISSVLFVDTCMKLVPPLR